MEGADDVLRAINVDDVPANVSREAVEVAVDRRRILTARVFRRQRFDVERPEGRGVTLEVKRADGISSPNRLSIP